ncbi:MAG TPA: succinylglutamate desuccinylase/aspartoacylase family protein, partial [Thermomicrobiaceae bacterium]|nr:succinylglutamate desuccinylase/aspartoacylase family protein [Thermomicrobiaceae bacterium]
MPQSFTVGTATAKPGGYAYGAIRVLDLPTGGHEEIPVVIAQGTTDGPTVWVTANIHGGELTGLASLHQILQPELPGPLSGTLIAIPSLNPAGLRVMQRAPYYEPGDPNRTWPLPGFDPDQAPSSVYESISRKLFDIIVGTKPACLLDLHNASIGSIPFTIRDRILYGNRTTESQAREMERQLDRLSEAFGISIVNENPGKVYGERKLHRSVSG